MNIAKLSIAAATSILLLASSSSSFADDPSPKWLQSQVQAHLRLELKDDVKEVHFIDTNNDGNVFTKVYPLKHADPYELRPYLIFAVGGVYDTANVYRPDLARKINTFNTKVECIKYMDGQGMLIVSAEDYRFTDPTGGMTIDEIVSILDQPEVSSSTRKRFMLYFPKYWDADSLAVALSRVGLSGDVESQWEVQGGKDRVRVDKSLNGLMIGYSTYSGKTIEQMLSLYDRPCPEALISYTVYEYDNEIDSLVGTDLQAWKNGPGTDLFSVASRYTKGWNVAQMAPARSYVQDGNARYFNFSPKWNTKYLDFLASKGKAQVVTSGFLSVMNGATGYIGSTIRVPTFTTGAARSSSGITQVRYFNGSVANLNNINFTVTPSGAATTSTTVPLTEGGAPLANPPVVTSGAGTAGLLMITEAQWTTYNGNGSPVVDYTYYMKISPTAGEGASIYDSTGASQGTELKMYSPNPGTQINFTVSGAAGAPASWTTAGSGADPYYGLAIQKAPKRATTIQAISTTGDDYGFQLSLTPVVNEAATTLNLEMVNTSLIGLNSDGAMRTSRSQVKTQVSVANGGERFVIGGLDKEQVLRGQNGLPWLENIPGLGWLVADERETHKKSQLVAVIECVPAAPDTSVPAGIMSEISASSNWIRNYGVKAGPIDENDYGFEQFLIDSEKKSFDPLP